MWVSACVCFSARVFGTGRGSKLGGSRFGPRPRSLPRVPFLARDASSQYLGKERWSPTSVPEKGSWFGFLLAPSFLPPSAPSPGLCLRRVLPRRVQATGSAEEPLPQKRARKSPAQDHVLRPSLSRERRRHPWCPTRRTRKFRAKPTIQSASRGGESQNPGIDLFQNFWAPGGPH